jgi:hypothetical protein
MGVPEVLPELLYSRYEVDSTRTSLGLLDELSQLDIAKLLVAVEPSE